MTDTELKELNEKLALAVGFKPTADPRWIKAPDNYEIKACDVPDFPCDMNACIQWIKPVLKERGISRIVFAYQYGIWCELEATNKSGSWLAEIKQAETESIAFCLAALKFLSEGK
jgi:hypothetical protein